MTMATHAHDTMAPTRRQRADAGALQLSQRDIDGLLLCSEHPGAPFDLLAIALRVEPERVMVQDLPDYAFAPVGSLPGDGPMVAASGPRWVR